MYREADGPDDIRRAVREQIRAGADFLKIMSTGARSVELENPHPSQCTPAEMEAFIDEAHRQGYRAAAHCEGLGGTELAVVAGADTIEHGFYLNQRPDLLDLMAARGAVLVPTLSFLHDVAEDGHWTPELIEQGEYNLDQANRTIAAAKRAGVRLALGYDSPESDLAANELLRMIEHGVGPTEALSAATHGSAVALGIDSEVGTIEPGKLADLVLVDGDPSRTPSHLTDPARIHLVTRNGQPAAGSMLEAAL
jgi:imidazolonepropionase-like amidohydrolase